MSDPTPPPPDEPSIDTIAADVSGMVQIAQWGPLAMPPRPGKWCIVYRRRNGFIAGGVGVFATTAAAEESLTQLRAWITSVVTISATTVSGAPA